uniref:Putative secreted protein n=1 Tax=Ixodes ricinus TaxID=34613 RepID=A0A6B0TVA4_IXORI
MAGFGTGTGMFMPPAWAMVPPDMVCNWNMGLGARGTLAIAAKSQCIILDLVCCCLRCVSTTCLTAPYRVSWSLAIMPM